MINNKVILFASIFVCAANYAQAGDVFEIKDGDFSLNEIVQNIGDAKTIKVGALGTSVSMTVYKDLKVDLLADKNLIINGDTWVEISSDYEFSNGVTLASIDGANFLHVFTVNNGSFNFLKSPVNGNTISLSWERTINYGEALNSPSGYFLNDLRLSGGDDNLISKLDNANSINEFNDIMNRSARLHPILFMRSVHEINTANMLDIVHHKGGISLDLTPMYIFSSKTSSVGAKLSADFEVLNNLFINVSGYGYSMKYEDDINNYKNALYGGNVRIDYFGDIIFVRSVLGANISMFDVGPVLNGVDTVNNPNGSSFYGYADFGKRFDINNELSLSPFIGLGGDRLSILDEKESNSFGRIGLDVGYKFDLDGLRQEYTLRAAVNTDGYFDASLNFDIWSNVDSAGAELSVGIIQTEIGTSGKISGQLKFAF